MNTNLKIFLGTVIMTAALGFAVNRADAQMKSYQLSPAASVSQTVGLTDISVTYHRPGVKGRVIWGALEPYDKVWRAGANEATTISFSDDVTIDGKPVKAGMYAFFVIPRQGDWTVILNSEAKQWGAFRYDSTKDVVKFSVKPETAPNEERLSYSFTDLTGTSVKLVLRWEKIALPVSIDVKTDANFANAIKAALAQPWQEYNNYAQYCLDSKSSWEKGMEAAEKSISLNENASNLRTKAELLAQAGKTKEAIEVAEKAINVGKAANPRFNSGEIDDLISEWKKK
jgi:Protein of unknown function (DUF2911)